MAMDANEVSMDGRGVAMDDKEQVTESGVQSLLEWLYALQRQREVLEADRKQLIEQVIPKEVSDKIAEIEADINKSLQPCEQQISELSEKIRAMVLEIGRTVQSQNMSAVFYRGRVSWDDKMLEGLSLAFPQLKEARRVGNPSVTIRTNSAGIRTKQARKEDGDGKASS